MAFRGLAHALNLNAKFQLFGERVHHFHWCVKKFLPEAHDVKSWADDVIEKAALKVSGKHMVSKQPCMGVRARR